MKTEGQKLDLSFEVKAAVEGEKWEGKFAELITRPTIVSVYMRNNTSSCDKQCAELQQAVEGLDKFGVGLIGISKDTPGSHLRFAQKHAYTFPLVSDPDHAFARATDSLVEKKMYGKTFFGPTRSAFLIDLDGSILGLVEKVDAESHGSQLLELVKD